MTNQKPVDDKDSSYQILSNLFVLGLQAGAKTKTAKEVGYPIKEALVKLDAHYQKKYLGLEKKLLDFGGWIKGHCDLHERYTSACVGCQRELRAFGIIRGYQDFIREAIANIGGDLG